MPLWSSRAWGPCNAASRQGPRTAQPAQTCLAAAAWGPARVRGRTARGRPLRRRRPGASPAPVGPLTRCWRAGELLVGGREPLGEWWLPVAGAELPGDVTHIAVGHPQPPGEPARAQRPGRRVLLLGVPELFDPLGGDRRPGAQLGELQADLPLVAAQLP